MIKIKNPLTIDRITTIEFPRTKRNLGITNIRSISHQKPRCIRNGKAGVFKWGTQARAPVIVRVAPGLLAIRNGPKRHPNGTQKVIASEKTWHILSSASANPWQRMPLFHMSGRENPEEK